MVAYTRKMVEEHNLSHPSHANDVWVIFEENVYNVTSYLFDHPGGDEVLKERAGKDITQDFIDVGHSGYAREIMKTHFIGQIQKPSTPSLSAPMEEYGTDAYTTVKKQLDISYSPLKSFIPVVISLFISLVITILITYNT